MVKMDHIGLLTDHKEPKNRLKRGCVFGPKDLFYEDFFWYPLPILRKKIAKQDLNCYLAASVCVPVCLCVGTLNVFWLCVQLLRNPFLYIRATRLC